MEVKHGQEAKRSCPYGLERSILGSISSHCRCLEDVVFSVAGSYTGIAKILREDCCIEISYYGAFRNQGQGEKARTTIS
jgi:hypothetical protein